LFAICGNHASGPQVGEVFGYFDLRFAKDVLEMTDAQRRLHQQMQDAKPGPVAEALINANEIHCRQLTTGSVGGTTRVRELGFAPFARAALRPTAFEDDVQISTGRSYFVDRILRYHAAIVFDIHIQISVRNHAFAEPEDLCKAIGPELMIRIFTNVCLQNDLFLSSS
jgi:hypothetical protein